MISLRPYQLASIEHVRAAIRGGKRRVMLTIPTGGGKTLTAAAIIAGALAKGRRALFVAHRLELIDQTVATFARMGITSVGVIRAGDKRRDASQPIQVASIQTLARRTQQDVDLVVIDEAHRGVAASYTKHLFDRHQNAVILGLSATPCRSDGRPLGSHFDELVIGARYSALVADGHIVAPLVYSTPVLPDMSSVRTSNGEFNQDDLEAAMNRGALIGDIVAQWLKHPRQRTVVFAISVAHSQAIVDQFRGAGIRAEHLDGTTPEDERRAILARLDRGETELVSNVGVLCLDDRTEILTRQGWVMSEQMTLTHDVAAWRDDRVVFERPTAIHRRQRMPGESMVRFGGERLSVRVTEGHNLVHSCGRASRWSKSPARNVVGRVVQLPVAGLAAPVRFEREACASDAKRQALLMTKTRYNIRHLEGRVLTTEELEAETARRVDRRLAAPSTRKLPHELSDDECRFIGFWLGDGARQRLQSGGVQYVVAQSHRYAYIIEWFEALVGRLGYAVRIDDKPAASKSKWLVQRRWSFCRGTGGGSQERSGLLPIESYLNKDGADLLWGLSRGQLHALLEGFWLADGNHGQGGPLPRHFIIHNTNRALIDLIQAVCVCRGMSATIRVNRGNERRGFRRIYRLGVSPNQSRFFVGRDRFELESKHVDERVWCVTVPSGNIITRRDGLVLVVGNCEGWDMPSCKRLILARPDTLALYIQMGGESSDRGWTRSG